MTYQQELLYIRIGNLVTREIEGTISAGEKEELETLLNLNPENRVIYNDLIDERKREEILRNVRSYDCLLYTSPSPRDRG